jgi:hypothetical protein
MYEIRKSSIEWVRHFKLPSHSPIKVIDEHSVLSIPLHFETLPDWIFSIRFWKCFFLPRSYYPTEYNRKGSDESSPACIQKVTKSLSYAFTYAAAATFPALLEHMLSQGKS